MTFADKLKALREKATKEKGFAVTDLERFLVNHAEELESLVRAAEEYEKESTSPVKDYGLVAIRRKQVFDALAALNKEKT